MVKRFHCEFRNCKCSKYQLFCSGKCIFCKHGKIWHSLKEIPPKTNKYQFFSIRKNAHNPKYVSSIYCIPTIFTPVPVINAVPINEDFNEYDFCITVEALPV